MKNLQVLVSAFLGGTLVAVSGMANLLLRDTHPIAAALLFGVMLLAVLVLELHLMTAKAGYLFWDSSMIRTRAVHLVLTLFGNVIGAAAVGELLRRAYPDRAFIKPFISEHFSAGVGGVIAEAVLCGMLMFVAVHAYRRSRGGIGGALVTLGAGAAIVLCGFEHSVTDMFYVAFGHVYTGRALSVTLLAVCGNLVGAVAMSLLYEYKKSAEEVYREQEEAEDAAERRHAHRHHHMHTHASGESDGQ